jgi:hypothetical protein
LLRLSTRHSSIAHITPTMSIVDGVQKSS